MAYHHFKSTFDPIVHVLASVADPADAELVVVAEVIVADMLRERFLEEQEEEGDYRLDFAARRIEGTVKDLRDLRIRASMVNADDNFIALIDEVMTDAQAAISACPKPDGPPAPAAWATAPIETNHNSLPEFLKDI